MDAARIEAQDPGAAGIGDALDAVLASGLKDVVRADEVALEHGSPLLAAGQAADVGNGIHATRGFQHRVEVGEVGHDRIGEVGYGHAVVAAHLVARLQAASYGRANAAGCAGYEYAHGMFLSLSAV